MSSLADVTFVFTREEGDSAGSSAEAWQDVEMVLYERNIVTLLEILASGLTLISILFIKDLVI
jgi:hypothetical protein